ncbi:MAG: PAS domain S-box protein [Chloroflexi bacterium]|nr:PAS domain S-box protein [Chloroflexota bacterium]
MSQPQSNTAIHSSGMKPAGYVQRVTRRLWAYRPRWQERRFWILQALVISLAGLHIGLDSGVLKFHIEELYFLPSSLLLAPVVFAALTYGFVGAITTTLWVVVLTIPDMVFWHQGLERIGIISQLLLLGGIASYIGRRVDRERRLRRQVENAAVALKASTVKYQGLLESNPIAVLIVNPDGSILEVNPSATILFGKNKTSMESMRLADIFEAGKVQELLGSFQNGRRQVDTLTLNMGGREVILEPRLTETDDGKGNPVIQVLLRDITDEYHRRAGLRAYAAEILRALEEERQLLARELHDETIQALILVCRQLGDIEESLAPYSPLVIKLKEAHRGAEEVVKGLRDFAKALRPPILDDLGLTISIRRLLSDFTERTKIEGQLMVSGHDHRLTSDIELGIFRITQEALRNVERHAGANYVAVIITFTEHGVRLDVVDNGVGFSTPPASSDFTVSGHLGLISMQERAQLLGGKLEIQSSPGKGTKVTLSVPDTHYASQIASHHLQI